jgi:subtilase family serine protease
VTADGVNGNGVEDSIAYAIDNNAAPILSTSYGLCEAEETTSDVAAQNSLFQEANANGMTIVSASGDAGAADCDSAYPATLGLSVDFPSASPYVTGVGGTTLTVTGVGTYWGAPTNSTTDNLNSALQYIPESVWNDTNALNGLSAGGGGASVLAAKPDWQTGTGVPNDGHRDVPDIALAASPSTNEMLFCSPGFCTNGFRDPNSNLDLTGGTSAGAPPFAGVLALLVQQTGSRLGNINPNLYTIAQISQTAFHDITSGNNIVPCRVGTLNCSAGAMGYSAGIGYDQASGWGSIDAYNLVEQWSEDIEITASPTTLTVQPGSSGTATVTVAPFKNFSGTVSFACSVSSGLANVTCSVPSTTVDTQGTTMVTIAAASTAHSPFWRGFRNVPPVGRWWILLALALAIALRFLRKRRFVYSVGAAAAVLMFVLGALSCGGGSSTGSTGGGGSTPAESGTVTVTATSGQIINSVSIGVTIP